jgi:hypothetical protein
MPTALLVLLFFDRSLHFGSDWLDCNPPICPSCVAGITGVCHSTQLFCWNGVFLTFCLGWLQNCNPPDLWSSWYHRCVPLHPVLFKIKFDLCSLGYLWLTVSTRQTRLSAA